MLAMYTLIITKQVDEAECSSHVICAVVQSMCVSGITIMWWGEETYHNSCLWCVVMTNVYYTALCLLLDINMK